MTMFDLNELDRWDAALRKIARGPTPIELRATTPRGAVRIARPDQVQRLMHDIVTTQPEYEQA